MIPLRPRLLILVAALVLCSGALAAEESDKGDLVRAFRTRNVLPSKLVERFSILNGTPEKMGSHLELKAEDRSHILRARVPKAAGDKFERHRLMMEVDKAIQALDQPVVNLRIHLTMVQGDLLSDAEFRRLDTLLREKPVITPDGSSPKGVVYGAMFTTPERTVVHFQRSQGEKQAQTRKEKILGTGSFVADSQSDGAVKLILEFAAESERALYADKKEWSMASTVATKPGPPLVFVAGKRLNEKSEAGAAQTFPGQHELMLYVHTEIMGK